MTSRSGFVVGTVNGKCVAYIADKPPIQNRSSPSLTNGTTAEPSRTSSARPSTSPNVNQHELQEAARINGSVTLTQKQLKDLLDLLDKHAVSSSTPVRPIAHEAWISSASSCALSGDESGHEASAPATPGPAEYNGVSPYASIKAAFTHTRSYDVETFETPVRDQGLKHVEEDALHKENEYSDGCQFGMKPPLSLLEQKKQQWAKERAELEYLCSPWGQHDPLRANYPNKTISIDTNNHSHSSLPAINREPLISPIGYTSDRGWSGSMGFVNETSLPHSITLSPAYNTQSPVPPTGRNQLGVPQLNVGGVSSADESGYSQVSNKSVRFSARMPAEGEEHNEEGRSRWGDKGVGVGHLWEPSAEPSARLPDPQVNATSPGNYPAWLERSLSQMGSISPGPPERRNFLRGQNVPLDPSEIEERERKRQKALENQRAIKQQLEDRERRRREEKEKRICEERREEERVRREQEMERARMEQERRREQAAKEAKEARNAETTKITISQGKKGANKSRDLDKPINLSPRIVNVPQRSKHVETSTWEDNGRHEMYSMHRGMQNVHISNGHHGYSRQDPGMMMVGQEVAVLLAPELEERLLHSRSAKDQATQTEVSQHLRDQKCRKSRPVRNLAERPQWGANRSIQRYMKQSDKDVYRQRGSSVGATPPKLTERHVRHLSLSEKRNARADSTEESDRSPPLCLGRRRAMQSRNNLREQNSSDEEEETSRQAWGSANVQVWSNKNCVPPPLHSPASLLELQEPVDHFDAIFNPPLRATNSPPVPAVAKKMEKQPELYKQPPRREPTRPPLYSPPVPAVMRKIQEADQLPNIADVGNKSTPSASYLSNGACRSLLPEIQAHENKVPAVDILSQLSTLRKALQTKQSEWENRSDTPYSDS